MIKKLLCLFAVGLCLLLCACNGDKIGNIGGGNNNVAETGAPEKSESGFVFTYESGSEEFFKEKQFSVTVKAKNEGEDYRYVGSPVDLFGPAKLEKDYSDQAAIECQPFSNTTDATERVFKKGDEASVTYYFTADASASTGLYRLKFSFADTDVDGMRFMLENPVTKDEETAVRGVADKLITEKYKEINVDNYRVRLTKMDDGGYQVSYTLLIGGYSTGESYSVHLDKDMKCESIIGDYGSFAKFLPVATEEKISAAKAKLDEKTKEYGAVGYMMVVDGSGNLCLYYETIVELDAPDGQSGCNIDHKHVILQEIVCTAA